MKIGDVVKIIPSIALEEMGLKDLVGRKGAVVEVLENPNKTIRGCWVSLMGGSYKGEQEWYLPFSSYVE